MKKIFLSVQNPIAADLREQSQGGNEDQGRVWCPAFHEPKRHQAFARAAELDRLGAVGECEFRVDPIKRFYLVASWLLLNRSRRPLGGPVINDLQIWATQGKLR